MPRVDCFLLADAAQAVAGKLYVLGGGWDHLVFSQFPAVVTFDIAVRVVIPWTETNRPLRFELQMDNEDGQRILNSPALTGLTSSWSQVPISRSRTTPNAVSSMVISSSSTPMTAGTL